MAMIRFIFILSGLIFFSTYLCAAEYPPGHFVPWLGTLEADAIADGVSSQTVHAALDPALLDERVVALDRRQPEQTVRFDEYVKNTLSPSRIDRGHQLIADNISVLNQISAQYGVPPEIIVALWGIESSYGKFSGNYNVVDSLMTLAFEGRRADFFRHELFNALHILDEEHISSSALRGSWAGAMGQCQFMPSTYRLYAVDYDGNGRKDIWASPRDVWASIAYYLSSEGWRAGNTWGFEVSIPQDSSSLKSGLDNMQPLSDWLHLGIAPLRRTLPEINMDQQMALVQPDGEDGRSFLVYDNYRSLMRWNRSTYFATTVGLLADRIK